MKTVIGLALLVGLCNARLIDINNGEYVFDWTIDGDTISVTATARTTGYVGFGISPFGDMVGADLFIGGVDANGPYFDDFHGQTNGPPTPDLSIDYELISASENSTHTTVSFKRALDTGDSNDIPISGTSQYIIWSYGETDDLEYHGRGGRGTRILNLMEG